ncbi:protein-glutamate O-methyltransferase [Rhodobacter sp. NSM]|uniref:protein-glutamate O-methyltransferase n=1 Tax=Rhodobacter sp. NSM TaxID=3457501 RepID=UPI003FD423F9
MTPRSLPLRDESRDLQLSAADFQRIARLVHSETGIAMPDAKEPLVYARLVKRLRQLSLRSFGDYIDLLSRPEAGEERAMFISSITTNTTRFFREQHHFELLGRTVLPPLFAEAKRGARIRLWSAGCSSGEEAYSIAITVLRLCPKAADLDLKVLATDIDREILETARAGRFAATSLSILPDDIRESFFGATDAEGKRQVAPQVRGLVSFKSMNLVKPWPVTGPFDVIFCRNVAIYFDVDTQERIWRGFAGALAPGGHLFIGHSERLSPPVRHQFETVGMTSFRLRAAESSGGQGKESFGGTTGQH